MKFNKDELEKIKNKLLKLREKILNIINDTNKEVKDSEDSNDHSQQQADEGTDDFIKTINLEVSNTEQSIIKEIDRALEKIDEGTYGICDMTEKEIPRARLEAIPYAIMTVDAQEKLEQSKM
jgi:DnaK suppressor protein